MKLRKGRVFLVCLIIGIVIGVAIYITNKNQSSKKIVKTSDEQTEYQDSIRLGVSNFDTINPILTKNNVMININKLIFDSLFEITSGYKLEGCLVKEYAKTSANTYVIKVDDSIKWSDGTSFSAKDVKYTIDLIKSRENIFSENVRNIDKVEVIDDSTIKITLLQEEPFFEYNLIFPIVSKNYYGDEDFFASNKKPIGTGRYIIDSITNTQITLLKNPNYIKEKNKNENINKIYINLFNEIGELYNSFKMGNIDVFNASSMQYKNYIGTLGYYVKDYKGREFDFLSCNCNDYIMKDVAVRQAINYAIDKDKLVSSVYNNSHYKSSYFLDYGNYLYSSDYIQDYYSLEQAKEILINGGWTFSNNTWRKNGIVLNLNISYNSSNKKRGEVAKAIKSQLEEIGINVNIRELSDYEYNSCINNKNYQILLTGIYNGYSPNLSYFYNDNNLANYNNETIKNLINEVLSITDEKVLKEKYEQIIRISNSDCAYIGLYRNKNSIVISRNMSGNFEPNNNCIFNNFETWNRVK